MKRILLAILCSVMLCLSAIPVVAASYPLIYPDDYRLYVRQGSVAKLKFTIFPEYKNEEYHVNVYKGKKVNKNNLVASASDTIYNSDYDYVRDVTITWDTSEVACGTYTVEYYMSFYSLYEWHDAPTKSTLMTVEVFKPGQVANSVLNTDIKAYIDGHPIRSYNIDGYTSIVVEDLNQYGFSVAYDNNERTLKINDIKGPITSTYTHIANTQPVGSKAMNVYYTDIRTYVKSKNSSGYLNAYGYNADGLTLIKIDNLDEFGSVVWDEGARTISFDRT